MNAIIRILDEVNIVVTGLKDEHMSYLYDHYGIPAPNYFFSPLYKLGRWDGRIRFFKESGKTFLYLIEDLLPRLVKLGYKIKVEDKRTINIVVPDKIDGNSLSDCNHLENETPIIMRQHQVDAVNSLFVHGYGVIIASTGSGKAQPLSSKVLTTMGWKNMGEVVVGDEVITPKNKTAKIIGIFPQGEKQIYKITMHDGSTVRATGDHLWLVNLPKYTYASKSIPHIKTTDEIKKFLETKKYGNVSIDVNQPLDFQHQHTPLPIHPYVLGVLLGDGCLRVDFQLFTSADDYIVQKLKYHLQNICTVVPVQNYDYKLTHPDWNSQFNSANMLRIGLQQLNLLGTKSHTKFIPEIYKNNDRNTRLQIIQGLLDTDGSVNKQGGVEYYTTSELLANDLAYIARSLGYVATIRSRQTKYKYKDTLKRGRLCYTVSISGINTCDLFSLPRKKEKCNSGKQHITRRIVSVEEDGIKPAQCIMVDDPEHLYITDNFITTHNTIMCAALVRAYDKFGIKSLTIVPNQDLIKQTKAEYINAKLDTGEYSGKEKTLDHRHVVSTWQALKNNPKLIAQFQMVIVDEAHGVKGNVLSNILTNHASQIPYRFGFTGTLPKEKTDQLSVLTALGPVRYKVEASDLIDQGLLANLHIDMMMLTEDLKKDYNSFLDNCIGEPPSYQEFKEEFFPDYSSEKSFLQKQKLRIEWIANEIKKRQDEKKGNVLCLVDSISFGRKLAKHIPDCIFVNGQDVKESKQRKEVYDLFKDNDNLVVIATVHIAGTGISINRIFNVFLVDMGKSYIRVIQAIGRGLRKSSDKDRVKIIDIYSDMKYSKRHAKERIKYYKEAKYPYTKYSVDYVELIKNL